MMDSFRLPLSFSLLLTVSPAVLLPGCGTPGIPFDPSAHRAEIEEWRASRLKGLTADNGWLTLVGLSWLKEGRNVCGSSPDAEVKLPSDKAPASVGMFLRRGRSVRYDALPGVETLCDDTVVTSVDLLNDNQPGGPTILRLGTLSFYVISRDGELGVRIKDSQSAARLNFPGLDFFPIDPGWRIIGHFEPFQPAHVDSVPTAVGTMQTFTFPGRVIFEVNGREYRLDAATEEGEEDNLYFMFTDETSGAETYGAGRQLYAPLPDEENRVILDFNKAYNWPCVFTEFATCPLPPKQNHLSLRVDAGEKLPRNYSGGKERNHE